MTQFLYVLAHVYSALKKTVAACWFGILMTIFVGAIIWGVTVFIQAANQASRNNDTSPSFLKDLNQTNKRKWVLECINNSAAGVLGGATLPKDAIAMCGDLGEKLYPDRDWEYVAMINWEKQQLGSSPDVE